MVFTVSILVRNGLSYDKNPKVSERSINVFKNYILAMVTTARCLAEHTGGGGWRWCQDGDAVSVVGQRPECGALCRNHCHTRRGLPKGDIASEPFWHNFFVNWTFCAFFVAV